jgi:hypothetical protein
VQFPITIGLRRSHFLDVVILLCAMLASATALLWQPFSMALPYLALIVLLSILAFRGLAMPIHGLRLERGGQISVLPSVESEYCPVELLPNATVHPWVTVLHLRFPDETVKALVITAGRLSAHDFRRLRVFLRWQAEFTDSVSGV